MTVPSQAPVHHSSDLRGGARRIQVPRFRAGSPTPKGVPGYAGRVARNATRMPPPGRSPLSAAAWLALLGLLLAAPLGAGARRAAGEEGDGSRPAPAPAAALVDEWCAADPPSPRLLARLCAQVEAVAPEVHRRLAAAPADPALVRLRAQLERTWHLRHRPEGMVYVPAGELELPRPAPPPHGPGGGRARVAAFYLDRTEVTVAAWRTWLDALARGGEEAFSGLPDDPEAPADHPVVGVTWLQAERYAREARGGRLPRLEEYERALRGSSTATWPWGEAAVAGRANLKGAGPGRLTAVGSFPDGASPFGALDLVGNAAEWTATPFRWGRVGRHHQVFGGSYQDLPEPARLWRAAERQRAPVGDDEGRAWLGFRVLVEPPDLPGP